VIIQPDGAFACSGPLFVTNTGLDIGTQTVAMACEHVTQNPFEFQGRQVRARPATITVMTTSGTVTRSVGAMVVGPPTTPLTIPVGTLVAFSGTIQDAVAQTAFGWWVADGRKIDDPLSRMNNTDTPDLKDRFVLGSISAGRKDGAASFKIENQTIDSHTTGGFGPPAVTSDPFTHMQGAHTHTTDSSIYSQGTWTGVSVPTMPPFCKRLVNRVPITPELW